MGELLTPLAMQQSDVHLCRHRAGVKLVNHFYRSSRISGQSEQIDAAAINQTESDSGMPQAVQGAICTVWASLDTQILQYPIERPACDVDLEARTRPIFNKH